MDKSLRYGYLSISLGALGSSEYSLLPSTPFQASLFSKRSKFYAMLSSVPRPLTMRRSYGQDSHKQLIRMHDTLGLE